MMERLRNRPLGVFDEVRLLTPLRHNDERGWFVEQFNQRDFAAAIPGHDGLFVQDNVVASDQAGQFRGLHFQGPKAPMGKLVIPLSGSITEYVMDMRPSSPAFGKVQAVQLAATSPTMVWVPRGFAHGFMTMEPNTDVMYKADAFYDPENAFEVTPRVIPGFRAHDFRDERLNNAPTPEDLRDQLLEW
jgi:dTDP-4-dehydrorhamnose 3,5-epimerase